MSRTESYDEWTATRIAELDREIATLQRRRAELLRDAKERREFPDKLIGIFKRAFRDAMKRKTRRNPRGTDATH